MPAPAHIQATTLNKFIEGWKEFTPEAWTATWSDDCQQKMLPFTLGIPSRSLAEVQLNIYEIVHDIARGKAVIYATSHADTPFGDFKWTNEYAVFVTFSENGEKIDKVEEMVDTAFFREFAPKFQKYLSEQNASV